MRDRFRTRHVMHGQYVVARCGRLSDRFFPSLVINILARWVAAPKRGRTAGALLVVVYYCNIVVIRAHLSGLNTECTYWWLVLRMVGQDLDDQTPEVIRTLTTSGKAHLFSETAHLNVQGHTNPAG